MLRQIQPLFFTFLSLLALTSVLPCTTAQSFQNTTSSSSSSAPSATPSKPALKIGDSSGSIYVYIGCWNESAGLPGTTGLRALDGINEAKPGVMTVERCLDFCAHGNKAHGAYQFAGLEYARECWCGDNINVLSVPLSDDACDLPCDGANTTACGGSLKLSLYNSTVPREEKKNTGNRRAEAWGGLFLGTMVLALGLALASL